MKDITIQEIEMWANGNIPQSNIEMNDNPEVDKHILADIIEWADDNK